MQSIKQKNQLIAEESKQQQ